MRVLSATLETVEASRTAGRRGTGWDARASIPQVVLVLHVALIPFGCGDALDPPTGSIDSAATPADVHHVAPGDGASVFGVGDRVKVGDQLYIFLGKSEMDVRRPDDAAPPGMMYAAFLVAFEGIAPDGSRYDHLSVQDDRGSEYSASVVPREPALEATSGSTGELLELAPGEEVHGWVTFVVPKAARWLDLVYRPDVRFVVRFRVTP